MKIGKDLIEIEVDGMSTLVIVLNGQKSTIDVKQLLSIDHDQLEEEVKKNASEYAYYSTVLAHYEYARDLVHQELKELKATEMSLERRGWIDYKKSSKFVEDLKPKDPTDTYFKEAVETKPNVKEKERDVLKANLIVGKLNALVRGLEKKGDRLAQIYSKYKNMERREIA